MATQKEISPEDLSNVTKRLELYMFQPDSPVNPSFFAVSPHGKGIQVFIVKTGPITWTTLKFHVERILGTCTWTSTTHISHDGLSKLFIMTFTPISL